LFQTDSTATYLVDLLRRLDERWVPSAAKVPVAEPSKKDTLAGIADAVAADGQQRAADIEWSDPEDMELARIDIREALIASDSPVRPWIWNATTSGGIALTAAGRNTGYELRFSRAHAKK
jgi:hypothetical protein